MTAMTMKTTRAENVVQCRALFVLPLGEAWVQLGTTKIN